MTKDYIEYPGTYDEVVNYDTYRITKLEFVPDIIFDIGANVGYFSKFARELFPKAIIVCVEPNSENYDRLCSRLLNSRCILLNKALGAGQMFQMPNVTLGPHQVYLSTAVGYSSADLDNATNIKSDVQSILIDELFRLYYVDGMKTLVKIDCEGGENSILQHEPSIQRLLTVDYIAAELHFYAADGSKQTEVDLATFAWMSRFRRTHRVEFNHVGLWMSKL